MNGKETVVRGIDLRVAFRTEDGRRVRAVDGVDLEVGRGEIHGLVGESGCGKTTLGRALLGLVPLTGGRVIVDGVDIGELRGRRLRRARARMQMIFQSPWGSLNPRMRVGTAIAEALRAHRRVSRAEVRPRVEALLAMVGLPAEAADRYPAAFSGGQRQRIAIARALAVEPRFIVADEAVASLDVSVGEQILELLVGLRDRLGLSYLFISHDLGVVERVADRVTVMYLGRVVERAAADELFRAPAHPYTVALLAAAPGRFPREVRRAFVLSGDPPSPVDPPSGCVFWPRCPVGPTVDPSRTICRTEVPPPTTVGDGHVVACHFPGEVRLPDPVLR
ncbi:MAG TPA: ABC transporter ATP-binding protein [Actinobacteria bacterium]|nr:ABC transporter ATP-binding protein [Actinomycetota bacterium]